MWVNDVGKMPKRTLGKNGTFGKNNNLSYKYLI